MIYVGQKQSHKSLKKTENEHKLDILHKKVAFFIQKDICFSSLLSIDVSKKHVL